MSQQKKDLRKKPQEKPKPAEKPKDMLCPDCGWPDSICGCGV